MMTVTESPLPVVVVEGMVRTMFCPEIVTSSDDAPLIVILLGGIDPGNTVPLGIVRVMVPEPPCRPPELPTRNPMIYCAVELTRFGDVETSGATTLVDGAVMV